MSRSGRLEDIHRIYAHPQSFAQTACWLRANLPHVEKIPVSSNAEGARRASNANDAASIGSESAARVYAFSKVFIHSIEDEQDNTTRFLVIGQSDICAFRMRSVLRFWCLFVTTLAHCLKCLVHLRVTVST